MTFCSVELRKLQFRYFPNDVWMIRRYHFFFNLRWPFPSCLHVRKHIVLLISVSMVQDKIIIWHINIHYEFAQFVFAYICILVLVAIKYVRKYVQAKSYQKLNENTKWSSFRTYSYGEPPTWANIHISIHMYVQVEIQEARDLSMYKWFNEIWQINTRSLLIYWLEWKEWRWLSLWTTKHGKLLDDILQNLLHLSYVWLVVLVSCYFVAFIIMRRNKYSNFNNLVSILFHSVAGILKKYLFLCAFCTFYYILV